MLLDSVDCLQSKVHSTGQPRLLGKPYAMDVHQVIQSLAKDVCTDEHRDAAAVVSLLNHQERECSGLWSRKLDVNFSVSPVGYLRSPAPLTVSRPSSECTGLSGKCSFHQWWLTADTMLPESRSPRVLTPFTITGHSLGSPTKSSGRRPLWSQVIRFTLSTL